MWDTHNFNKDLALAKMTLDDLKILSKLPKWPKMVHVINGLCYGLLFLQKLIWNSTRTLAFQAVPGFFETNQEVPAFFFQNCGKFI